VICCVLSWNEVPHNMNAMFLQWYNLAEASGAPDAMGLVIAVCAWTALWGVVSSSNKRSPVRGPVPP
jgi:hypothetical protein